MRRHILLYGLLGGLLISLLKAIEYRYLVIDYSVEIYGGLVAVVFAATGVWLGLKLTRPKVTVVTTPFQLDQDRLEQLRITPRELEVLQLIASGLSTREIAERIQVSENTIKTHAGHLFDKLGARRRTQAVQLAKEFRLIP